MKTKLLTTTIAFILGMGIQQNAHADLKDGLVAHWSFDDCRATDNSGNGHDGTIQNNVTCVDGIKSKALHLQGSGYVSSEGGHILIPKIDFSKMPEYSMCLWVKEEGMTSADGNGYISFGDFTGGSLGIVHSGNTLRYGNYGGKEQEMVTIPFPETDLNKFVYHCLSYNSGKLTAYKDGISLATIPYQTIISGDNAAIGRSWWYNGGATGTRFIGIMDDVRIYNRALTEAEVLELYNGGGVVAEKPVLVADTGNNGTCSATKTAAMQVGENSGTVSSSAASCVTAPEILNVEPWDAIKNKYTVFTVTGSNLTADNIQFKLADCVNANTDDELKMSTDTKRLFRCMPSATGAKIGRVLSADGKLLNVFHVLIAPKLPKISSVTPVKARFDEDTQFTIKGTDLASDMVYSLSNCDKIQEVGLNKATAKERYFQCTPKNSEGKQTGKITLKDGTLIKDFSVDVNSTVKAKTVPAELTYFTNPSFTNCSGNKLCGSFQLSDMIDVATFSAATPWYISVNGKKIYSGTLGDSVAGTFHFDSGETHINLSNWSFGVSGVTTSDNVVNFSWAKKIKKINFSLNGGLQTLISEFGRKPTIEFGFQTTKVTFALDLSKNSKSATVKSAVWSYDARNADKSDFLTPVTIALRSKFLNDYVYADIERKGRFWNAVNMKSLSVNELVSESVSNVNNAISIYKLYQDGKDYAKAGTASKAMVTDVASNLIKIALDLDIVKSIIPNDKAREGVKAVFPFVFDTATALASGDYIEASASISEKVLDLVKAYNLNDNLETIHAYKIANEVIKRYVASDWRFDVLANQVLPEVARNQQTWEAVILKIAQNMDCLPNTRCKIGFINEDYNPEVVNTIVQNYLATLRMLSGYGEFYLHNSQ
jgi:hypothetical protein